MSYPESLRTHLATGATHICRAWAVRRRDGTEMGFTDHDAELAFEGVLFAPGTGMSAQAIQQATGLAVDNTEAFGALSAAAITEADLLAGRYDGAEVRLWLVDWSAPESRALVFRGSLGEVTRGEGAFSAELRGLSEALGLPQGRVYHPRCGAVLGDSACGVDLARSGYFAEVAVAGGDGMRVFEFENMGGFDDRWFEKGRLEVPGGPAQGLAGAIKNDRLLTGGRRVVELWAALGLPVGTGEAVRITAGCDRRADTCRLKFANFRNFRGFPHIPGEDWLLAYPRQSGDNDGGSMNQ